MRKQIAPGAVEGVSEEEVNAHFEHMPLRYWEAADADEVIRGLRLVSQFLHGNMISTRGDTAVAIASRPCSELSCTKIMVCTWDRVGLLAKLAGYISALRLNIERAEVFTRADNIVLDVFWLSEGNGKAVQSPERIRDLEFLVRGGFSEEPAFVSTWACQSHKYLPQERKHQPPAVLFDNSNSAQHTIVTVQAPDRLGLLHDILQALADCRINVVEAVVRTTDELAEDVFFVTDEEKNKVTDESRLGSVRRALLLAAAA